MTEMDYRIVHVVPDCELWPIVLAHHAGSVKYMNDPDDQGNYHFFVAVDATDNYIGGAVLGCGPDSEGPLAGQVTGCLEDVEVTPEHRRKGIATALMRELLSFAWSCGAGHVWWCVSFDNPDGIAFYRSLGAAMTVQSDMVEGKKDEYYFVVVQNPIGMS